MKKYIFPFIVALLMALAVLLGLSRHDGKPEAADRSLSDYYQTAEQLGKQSQSSSASFLAVGDIMLSRNVAGTIKKAGNALLPFKNTTDLLNSTDFNFGNLESPLSGRDDFSSADEFNFNTPPAYAAGLKQYNFKVMNLANNHAFDQEKAGVDYTKKFLEGQGIFGIGTGDDLEEAWQPAVIDINGIKIGFVGASYSSLNDGGRVKNNYVARIEDTERLKASIALLKQTSDFIVVAMHAGTEYTRTPDASQTAFARAAIDAGADVVIGAHPHWVQTIEKYNGSPPYPTCKKSSSDKLNIDKTTSSAQGLDLGIGCGGKYIFYSLGNFIFDQMFSQETKEGLALKITLESPKSKTIPDSASIDDIQGNKIAAKIKHIELIPVIIENYSTPRLANDQEASNILEKIGQKDKILVP